MAPNPVPNPLFFEDLPLGGEWTTRGRTITAADLHAYMALAGDFHPLYADAAYASREGRRGIVAPAALIAAVALGLGAMDVPLPSTAALVGMEWRYLAPVHPGDTLHAEWRLGRKRPVDEPDVGLGIWQIEVRNQDDLVVTEGEVARLVTRRHHHVPVETSVVTEPEPEPSAEPLAVTAGANAERATTRRRRRRGGASSSGPGTASSPAPAVEAAVAEPAVEPPAAPASNGRRRRRRGGRGGGGAQAPAAEGETAREIVVEAPREPSPLPDRPQAAAPVAELTLRVADQEGTPEGGAPAPVETAGAATPSPRPRRRRSPRTPAAEPPAAEPDAVEPAHSEQAHAQASPGPRPSRRRRSPARQEPAPVPEESPSPAPAAAVETTAPRRRTRRAAPPQETPGGEPAEPETATAPRPRRRSGRRPAPADTPPES